MKVSDKGVNSTLKITETDTKSLTGRLIAYSATGFEAIQIARRPSGTAAAPAAYAAGSGRQVPLSAIFVSFSCGIAKRGQSFQHFSSEFTETIRNEYRWPGRSRQDRAVGLSLAGSGTGRRRRCLCSPHGRSRLTPDSRLCNHKQSVGMHP